MKHRHQQPRGYVLLVTLGLLVLATTLLVAVGRSAADHALLARASRDELQNRWAGISARRAVLPYAAEIFAQRESENTGVVSSITVTIPLGNTHLRLIIADEQAKANVNQLLDDAAPPAVQDRIREALSGSGLGNSLALRPSQSPAEVSDAASRPGQWITGPGQIFNALPPEKLPAATANLTCWGNGAINLMRAGEPAMRVALSPALTKLEISRLIDARDALRQLSQTDRLPDSLPAPAGSNKSDADPVNRLMASARIDLRKRGQIAAGAVSQCFSLWIILTDRQRSWTSLYVSDKADPGKPRDASFVW